MKHTCHHDGKYAVMKVLRETYLKNQLRKINKEIRGTLKEIQKLREKMNQDDWMHIPEEVTFEELEALDIANDSKERTGEVLLSKCEKLLSQRKHIKDLLKK